MFQKEQIDGKTAKREQQGLKCEMDWQMSGEANWGGPGTAPVLSGEGIRKEQNG